MIERSFESGRSRRQLAAAIFRGDSELARLCRQKDWSRTPLGPLEAWPPGLRAAAGLVVGAPLAMAVLWGPHFAQVYNDAWRELLGRKHPTGLGLPMREAWLANRESDADLLSRVISSGEAFWLENQILEIEREEGVEQQSFTLTYSVVTDDSGEIGGVLLTACRPAGHALASEVDAMRRLQELSAHTVEMANAHELHEEILDTAVAVVDADFGCFHIRTSERGRGEELRLIAHRRFSEEAAEYWQWLDTTSANTCVAAFRDSRRVEVPDVEASALTIEPDELEILRRMEIRAMQATPLLARSGRRLGTFATCWRKPRALSDTERRVLDVLARQAADLIERQRAERAVRESEQRYRELVSQVSDYAIFRTDPEGRPVTWNEGVQRLLGFTEREFIGADVTKLIFTPEAIANGVPEQEFEEAAESGAASNNRWMRRKSGELFFAEGITNAIRDHNDEVIGFTKVMRDHTELRLAEEALRVSERRYRTLFEAMDEAYAVVELIRDESGRWSDFIFLEVNPAFMKHTGLEYPVGRTARELLGTPNPRWIELYGQVAETGEPTRVEEREPVLDRIFDLYIFRLGSPGSRRIAVLFTDITERKRADAALRESEARLRRIFDDAPALIALHEGPEHRFVYVNGATRRAIGDRPLTGRPLVEALPEIGGHSLVERYDRVFRTGKAEEMPEFSVVYDANGSGSDKECFFHQIVQPRFAPDGSVEGVMTFAYNITEQVRAREALRENEERFRTLAEKLAQSDRRKDAFLATLAHELRNPLAPISTGLEVMKMLRNDPARLEEVRGMMARQTRQLVTLIDDLMDVSRITRGKLQLRKGRVSLEEVVQSAVEAARPLIDEANHELTVELPDEPVFLEADPNRLPQVFSNLLGNSARYTPEGGRIALRAKRIGDEVLVSVEDTGIGIPADKVDEIFEMFGQIEHPLQRAAPGLGLGLTLVRSLLEMHGGSIEVSSPGIGKGSVFTARLPILPSTTAAKSQDRRHAVEPDFETKRRVLVVDDNKAAAKMLGMAVRMFGNQVRIAHDGQEAIEAAAEFRPDAVLMDIGMPRMNGYEAARYIRRQPWGRDMLLVALTGWGQDEDKRRTREAGFDYHLVKPAEPSELQQLLESSTDRRPH